MTVGVLALQGDFALHAQALERIGVPWREVRKPGELDGLAGLIMPGGESTTLLKLMDAWDFFPALEKFHAAGKPIFGTCAGLILLARDVESPQQRSLGFIDITAERNAYGRQKESFETEVTADLGAGPAPLKVVFIRAPAHPPPGARGHAAGGASRGSASWPARARCSWPPSIRSSPTMTTVHRYFAAMTRSAGA